MALEPPDAEEAEACFELATGYSKGVDAATAEGAAASTLVALFCERAACAVALGSPPLAANLLGRAGALLDARGPSADSVALHEVQLTTAYIAVGKAVYQQTTDGASKATSADGGGGGGPLGASGAHGGVEAADAALSFFERAYEVAMRAAKRVPVPAPPSLAVASDVDGIMQDDDDEGRQQAAARQNALAREEMAGLERNALRCLSCLHTQLGRNDAALRCIAALRQLTASAKASGGGGRAAHQEQLQEDASIVPLLLVRALAGLGRVEEAEAAAMELVSQASAQVSSGWQAIALLIRSGRFSGAVAALETLERAHQAEAAELAAAAVEALLKEEERAASSGTDSGGAGSLAAELAAAPSRVVAVGDASTAAAMAARRGGADGASSATASTPLEVLWLLLWNGASRAFDRKDFALAMQLFETADRYAGSGDQGPSRRADGFRARALCAICTRQHDMAGDFLAQADELAPRRVTTGFLAAKVAIERADYAAARATLPRIAGADDFDPAFLTLIAHEAMHAGQAAVAADALEALLSSIQRGGAGTGDSGGATEVAVLRNLVSMRCAAGEAQEEAGIAANDGGDTDMAHMAGGASASDTALGDEPSGWMVRVQEHLEQALARMRELGFRRFFGCGDGGVDTSTADTEAAWFSNRAWALARRAAEGGRDWSRASALFALAGDMLVAMPEDAGRLRDAHAAFLLAAAAALQAQGERKMGAGSPSAQRQDNQGAAAPNLISQARGLMDKARRVASRADELPASTRVGAAAVTPLDREELARSAAMLDFEIAAHDTAARAAGGVAAEARIARMRAALAAAGERGRAADAESLQAMAALVTRGDACDPTVAVAAWRRAIDLLLRRPSPDYAQLAQAYRYVIDLSLKAMDEGGALTACREATRAASSTRSEDAWPAAELEWLAVRVWNYAVGQETMGRVRTAKAWQEAAIAVVERSAGLEARFGDAMRQHYADLLGGEAATVDA